MSVASDADANNLETQCWVLADCEPVFEDVGSGASWNRPGLNCLNSALQPGDCMKVAALDRLGRSLTEVLELLGWATANPLRSAAPTRLSRSGSVRTAPRPFGHRLGARAVVAPA